MVDHTGKGEKKLIEFVRQLSQQMQVSDIHLVQDDRVCVRGENGEIKFFDKIVFGKDDIWGFIHDVLSPYRVNELLDMHEIDSSYTVDEHRFRMNIYHAKDGIRIALRRISANPPSMEQIHLPSKIQKYLMEDKGLILVTGPTGSGKSTSMAAMIDYINENKKVHILTLEDPVEYVYQMKKALVTQREIGRNSNSWSDAMKYAMRQDPDVIMVGEMRDLETIGAVLTLVETGHLVMSTLHTIDSAQTITRIIDVFPAHQQQQVAVQLSLALRMIMSQRLLPNKQGTGRVAAREILVNTPAIANNIRERKVPQIISTLETGFKHGMKTMDQSLLELVVQGHIDLNTALPRVKNMESFKTLLTSIQKNEIQFRPVD